MNINLVGGDPYGGLCSIDQFFIWRPFASGPAAPLIRGLQPYRRLDPSRPGAWAAGRAILAAKRLGA